MTLVIHLNPAPKNGSTSEAVFALIDSVRFDNREVYLLDETATFTREMFPTSVNRAGLYVVPCTSQGETACVLAQNEPHADLIIVVRKHPVPTFHEIEALYTEAQRSMNALTTLEGAHKSLGYRLGEAQDYAKRTLDLAREKIAPPKAPGDLR